MPHRRRGPRATADRRRFACELALFINSDVGVWVWPVPAAGDARAFKFSETTDRRRRATCQVVEDGAGARCTCPDGPRCEHIRALQAVHLLGGGS
jgi:hypothetical protein